MTAVERPGIVVVGAGPVGLVCALELARAGVPCTVLERSLEPSRHPKMDFLNARTMEHFAALGLEEDIRAKGVAADREFWFQWRRDLDGQPLSNWRALSVSEQSTVIAAADDGSAPARPYQRIMGSSLERLLRLQARHEPLIDLREGVEVTSVEVSQDGARLGVRPVDGGTPGEWVTRYLVAADGAGGLVRPSVGISNGEQCRPVRHTDVFFRSSDPRLRRGAPPFLIVLGTGLTLVSRDGEDVWTATYPHREPGDESADPLDMVGRRTGAQPLRIDEVLATTSWDGRLAVADSYRRGPVFLAGDAAHTFFPTGGHGANTGIGDAVNLGWKLAACFRGEGGEALLNSYEQERRPVALFAREMCAHLLQVWQRFPALVAAGARDQQLTEFLDRESHQVSNVGVHFAADYSASPVVLCGEADHDRPWSWHTLHPCLAAGARLPHVPIAGRRSSHDLLGQGWAALGPHATALIEAGKRRGLPIRHVDLSGDLAAADVYQQRTLLVRPDHHIAWSAMAAPDQPDALVDHVLGRRELLDATISRRR